MAEMQQAYTHLPGVLNESDIRFLIDAAKDHLSEQDAIPSYVLIDRLNATVVKKVQSIIEERLGQPVFYLNDFYLYTDSSFGTNWHMDTELFTVASAVNAWILLSPDEIESPLCFVSGINDSPESFFHTAKIDGDDVNFSSFSSLKHESRSLNEIEATKENVPDVQNGDILLLNPRRFHRTNATAPKHCLVIKYVLRGETGFLPKKTVPAMYWPEVKIFKDLIRNADSWDEVVEGIRQKLGTSEGRTALSAGFYPEKLDLYQQRVKEL